MDETKTTRKTNDQAKAEAMLLAEEGMGASDVHRELVEQGYDVADRTVRHWFKTEGWDARVSNDEMVIRIVNRLLKKESDGTISDKEKKTLETNWKRYQAIMDRRRRRSEATKKAARSQRRKANVIPKNDFSNVKLENVLEPPFLPYQRKYLRRLETSQETDDLKSRRVGFSWVMAWYCLRDLVVQARNKIFLSATKRQSRLMRSYMAQFSEEYYGVRLTRDDTVEVYTIDGLHAKASFLSTNAAGGMGDGGDLIYDEKNWIPRLDELTNLMDPSASHKQYRIYRLSTPSVMSHPGYKIWKGLDDEGRPMWPTNPKTGYPDDWITRHQTTIMDAYAQGADALFHDLEYMKKKYARIWDQQFMCVWQDDSTSHFRFSALQACTDDPEEAHLELEVGSYDFRYDGGPCWLGIDTSSRRDHTTFVVVRPNPDDGRHTVVRHWSYQGIDDERAAEIGLGLCKPYRVVFVGIDITNDMGHFTCRRMANQLGRGVKILPIHYDLIGKAQLVYNAEALIKNRLLLMDKGDHELINHLLMIRTGITPNSNKMTFISPRSKENGHADLAWALLHALAGYEGPLLGLNAPSGDYQNIIPATTYETILYA